MAGAHAGTNDCEEAPEEEAEEEPLPEAAGEHDQREQRQPYEDDHLPTSCSLAKSISGHIRRTRHPRTLLASFSRDYAQDGLPAPVTGVEWARVARMDQQRLERHAELTVRFAANIAEGQLVVIQAHVEHAPLVRAGTRAAYRAGARWVGADYRDEHLRRALVELAPEEALTWTPPWTITRVETLAEEGGALIALHGDPEPDLLADVDGARLGRARPLAYAERWREIAASGRVGWTIVPAPTPGWGAHVLRSPR